MTWIYHKTINKIIVIFAFSVDKLRLSTKVSIETRFFP